MKKAFAYIAVAVLALSSCQTMVKTAKTVDAQSNIKSITVADLKVADKRVTATIADVSSDLRRGGEKNVKQAVEQKALSENGGGDLLVDPQYVVTKSKGLFGSKIKSITVSGRPAWYQNFRSLNDSIWNNPAFRQVVPVDNQFERNTFIRPTFGVKGSTEQKYPSFRRKGWHGNVDLYFGGGDFDGRDNDEGVDFSFVATANIGYQFGPYFYYGIGSGYGTFDVEHFGDNIEMVPFFNDLRFYLSRKASTFYVDVKLGSAFPVGDIAKHLDELEKSLFFSPSIGYSLGNLDLSAYYMLWDFEGNYKDNNSYYGRWTQNFSMNTWGLKLGLRF